MLRILLVLFYTVACSYGWAQVLQKSTFASSGGSALLGMVSVQSTIGQPSLVGSVNGLNTYTVQGFQFGSFLYYQSKDIQEISFRLYPNPTKNSTRLVVDSFSPTQVKMISVDGKIIELKVDARGDIDTSTLNSGMYYIKALLGQDWVHISKLTIIK